MKRILIGCNGGLTGIYLAKNLSEIEDIELIGADTEETTCGRFFVDQQVILPKTSDKSFVERLIHILNSFNIDYYFPTHSSETRTVSRNEEYIRNNTSARFLISPFCTYNDLDDKDIGNESLRKAGIPVPNLILEDNPELPVFMKKRNGSGSRGAGLVNNKELLDAYKYTGEYVFFEYIEGEEFTCDCLFDDKGSLISATSRKRVKIIGGAVSVTESADTGIVLPYIEKIASIWKLCGCVNFQYIIKDERPYFTDVNLRFPSGGLPLTVSMGIDIPKLIIEILDGKIVERIENPSQKRRMYRYFEEIIEDI
jgi:carbamoyl-phosphate synthase large subunit